MHVDEIQYRLAGLTKYDALELKTDPNFRIVGEVVPDQAHGELTTLTAYVIGSGIAALAAFLLKRHNGEEFTEEIEEIKPDGTTKRRLVRWKKTSSEAPDASVIKQIRGHL